MENASKALLIAAAVLIAIVLIALSVKLLNLDGDVAEQAEGIGKGMETTAGDKTTDIILQIGTPKEKGIALATKVFKKQIMHRKDQKPITDDVWIPENVSLRLKCVDNSENNGPVYYIEPEKFSKEYIEKLAKEYFQSDDIECYCVVYNDNIPGNEHLMFGYRKKN